MTALLQLCRFSSAIVLYFPGPMFHNAFPKQLRERALFAFKSGRIAMYSPPILDPMCRQIIRAHFSVMNRAQISEIIGIEG